MIRRFNYTKRQRIEKQNTDIEIYEAGEGNAPSFSATLDLNDMDLPPDAQIVIEAKRERSSRRFDWGTVASPLPPRDTRLTDMPPNPSFRVMVVTADGSGRLLALANSIKARRASDDGDDSPQQDSLLWLEPVDLGQEVWKIDFGVHDNPTMQVNKNIPDISKTAREDQAFRALVVPEALRSILTRALVVEECDPDDDDGQWSDWLEFIRKFHDDKIPGTSNDRDMAARAKWIDEAVEAFAEQRFHASDQYSTTRVQ